jgi:hypothetical protein
MKPSRLVVLALASVLCACSSSSGGGDPGAAADSGTKVSVDSGASSGGGYGDAAPPKLRDPAECKTSGDCYSCCQNDFAGGVQFYRLAEQQCICAGPGSCAGVCSYEECSMLVSKNQACTNCLQDRLSSVCDPKADQACSGDVTCATYARCLAGCR